MKRKCKLQNAKRVKRFLKIFPLFDDLAKSNGFEHIDFLKKSGVVPLVYAFFKDSIVNGSTTNFKYCNSIDSH